VISREWKGLVAVALLVAACGTGDGEGDDDAYDDGGPAADADPSADLTRDVAGGWKFTATYVGESAPFLSCAVSITDGVFDVICPKGGVPRQVDAGCTQIRDDWHVYGNILAVAGGRLDGMLGTVVEYSGDDCVTLGYTIGAPYPEPAFAQLNATHDQLLSLGDFLSFLGGLWRFSFDMPNSPSDAFTCDVHIGLDGSGVKLDIACPNGDPIQVSDGCTETRSDTLALKLAPGKLDGELGEDVRHEGASCGSTYPPLVHDAKAKLTARPQ
jgi:hypothetical protein